MSDKEVIVVDQFGAFLGRESGRLQVRQKKKTTEEYPFFKIERIVIASPGVSLSASLIQECVKHGIALDFLGYGGRPYARLSSPELSGTVKTRREQILAYTDARGLEFARMLVKGKLGNQVSILKYFAKYRKERDKETYSQIRQTVREVEEISSQIFACDGNPSNIDDDRQRLLSIEGRAGKLYWDVFTRLVPAEVGFEGREHQGATDPVNSLLNYGYGMLYAQVWGAIELAGLDPFAGFLHVDRPGKPSLVLDLIEEFRQQVVDRTVFGLVNRGYKPKMEQERLSDQTRKEFAHKILDRLEGGERYEGKVHKLRTIIQMQARHLAMFFRGERRYKAFVGSW
ncbi:MAG: CRISPR-associated endonuclease Cas1 [Candidatus Latescibacterota bacterium]|nr:MAG: CRISPR-associated endonuclease Cas1 [Candidatus Latescibacterota bacterium]